MLYAMEANNAFTPESTHANSETSDQLIAGPGGLALTASQLKLLKDRCDRVVQGQLAYEPTKAMIEGQATPVTARIVRGHDEHILANMPDGRVESVAVTCVVSAHLTAPDKSEFDIVSLDPVTDPRFLGENTTEQWTWRVTPLKHGKKMHLLLTVVPYVSGSHGDLPTSVHEIDREIEVNASRWFEAKKYAGQLWVLLGGATFLGGGVTLFGKALWERLKNRKKSAASADAV